MPNISDILSGKDSEVQTVSGDMTVLDATQLMNKHKIGAVVVMEEGKVAGMFTERDVLRRVVAEGVDPKTSVSQVMTKKVMICVPETSINDARNIMYKKRIRHLPVVSGEGELVGMISIGDLNAWTLADGEAQIQYMSEYIYGRV